MVVDSLGMELGLKDGDKVIAVDGIKMTKFNANAVSKEIIINEAKEVVVDRNGQEVRLSVPPALVSELTKFENKGRSLFEARSKTKILDVMPDGPSAKAGFTTDMTILHINDVPVEYSYQFVAQVKNNIGKNTKFTYTTSSNDTLTKEILIPETGKIGVGLEVPSYSTENFGLLTSFNKGANMSVNFLGDQLKAFGLIFRGKIKAKDSLGSVLSIATMFDSGWDWRRFWNITASLSILLAFFNLLPIPALDGGYVVFLLWEVITGKVPGDRFMEIVNYIGFFILIALMIFALGLDISRLF